jgi:hypothetical protein
LKHVFGIRLIAEHPDRETEMKIPVSLDEHGKRVNVTADDGSYELRIRSPRHSH